MLKRLRQRYGIHARGKDIATLAQLVGSSRSTPLCLQPPNTYVLEIRWRGRCVVAVWDNDRQLFKTALPMRGHRTVEEYLHALRKYYQW